MSKQKMLMRIDAPEVTPVIQDLRIARTVVEMLFLATPSMQQLLLGQAIATEEAVAHVLLEQREGRLELPARVVGMARRHALPGAPEVGVVAAQPLGHQLVLGRKAPV